MIGWYIAVLNQPIIRLFQYIYKPINVMFSPYNNQLHVCFSQYICQLVGYFSTYGVYQPIRWLTIEAEFKAPLVETFVS